MRRPVTTIVSALMPGLVGGAIGVSAAAAGPLTLQSQARSVTAESLSDLDRTGNNPDLDCILDESDESDASDFEIFEAYARVSPVAFECHTLISVSAEAHQNSWLSSTAFAFEGHVDMQSWGYAADMGGHVLGSSSGSVVFQLTEGQDYLLKGSLSSGSVGRTALRIVDKADDTTVISRVATDATVDFELAGRLPAGTFEFSIVTEAECGLDCFATNAYQATMEFGDFVPVPTSSMGTLKARY